MLSPDHVYDNTRLRKIHLQFILEIIEMTIRYGVNSITILTNLIKVDILNDRCT